MSTNVLRSRENREAPVSNYLNNGNTIKSWLLTGDHKRIAILYLISITVMFAIGGFAAAVIRIELTQPHGLMLSSHTYNKMFTMHGVVMIFFFLIPSIPATLGNFLVPMMIGARDLAFPRLNLFSWYLFVVAAIIGLSAVVLGGVDTGWTFYAPLSTTTNSEVGLTIIAAFLAGFSSIFTGLNFIVTIHKMRAPGMTWFRLPLFIWAHYATSLIMVLGTPVIAITLTCVAVERIFPIGIFDPAKGGDPVLFQHMFWFYSHPAVYIMILPGMGVISEVITGMCHKRVFGYHFIAMSSFAIALMGFFVWGHHIYVAGQSIYASIIFSLISFVLAVPSAIKIFNWTATIYKGSVCLDAPMLYALGFLGLFTLGGLTGLFLASLAVDIHLNQTYFVVAHFHYVMVGGAIMAYLAGIHYWWPKMTGRLYPEFPAKIAAGLTFIGFNLTFFPQFMVGYLGMPRRYHFYPPEFQTYHILSSAGASVLGVGYAIPVFYFLWSLKYGPPAGPNPWGAKGPEWTTASPPPTINFEHIPIVTEEAYDYTSEEEEAEREAEDLAHEREPGRGLPTGEHA